MRRNNFAFNVFYRYYAHYGYFDRARTNLKVGFSSTDDSDSDSDSEINHLFYLL
jgi:hypothetical protein